MIKHIYQNGFIQLSLEKLIQFVSNCITNSSNYNKQGINNRYLMEEQIQIIQKISLNFISKLTKQNFFLITKFLDDETIEFILQSTQYNKLKFKKVILLDVLFVQNFIHKYLNYTDRSTYIQFYEQNKYSQIQTYYMKKLLLNENQQFKNINKKIEYFKLGINDNIGHITDSTQINQFIVTNLRDPVLPFINLKKYNVGMYCNSGFQSYLIQKYHSTANQISLEPAIQQILRQLTQLKDLVSLNNIQSEQNMSLSQSQLIRDENQQSNSLSVSFVLTFSFRQKLSTVIKNCLQINSYNCQYFLIPKDSCQSPLLVSINNLIVNLIGLMDSFIESVDIYIQSLSEDLFHQFFQFNLRFNLFRHSCLEIMNQFEPMVSLYKGILAKLYIGIPQEQLSNFSLYKCFISKWYLRMSKRHSQFNQIYNCLLKRINLKDFLNDLLTNNLIKQQFQIYLQNDINSLEQDIVGLNNLYIQSQIHEYMEDQENVNQVLKEYVEYLVDISINQKSVHWCGHSSQQLFLPYTNYQQAVRQSLNEYFQKIYNLCNKIDANQHLFKQVINKIFYSLDQEYLKPVTLRKVIQDLNGKFYSKQCQNNSQMEMEGSNLQGKQLKISSIIEDIDFMEKDGRLQCANGQYGIIFSFDVSPSLYCECQDVNNLLKKSAQTKASRNYVDQQQDTFLDKVLHKTVSVQQNV